MPTRLEPKITVYSKWWIWLVLMHGVGSCLIRLIIYFWTPGGFLSCKHPPSHVHWGWPRFSHMSFLAGRNCFRLLTRCPLAELHPSGFLPELPDHFQLKPWCSRSWWGRSGRTSAGRFGQNHSQSKPQTESSEDVESQAHKNISETKAFLLQKNLLSSLSLSYVLIWFESILKNKYPGPYRKHFGPEARLGSARIGCTCGWPMAV